MGFRDVLMQELPTNTLTDHLTQLTKGIASYAAFATAALKMTGLLDKSYGAITLKGLRLRHFPRKLEKSRLKRENRTRLPMSQSS